MRGLFVACTTLPGRYAGVVPELPEVETTRRGIAPHVDGHRITHLSVYQPRLRWPVEAGLAQWATGQLIHGVARRAKYLLLQLDKGHLMLHLGMSGSLRIVPADAPRGPHDHVDIILDCGQALRFNDPRRFGSLLRIDGDPALHPLLRQLAPEPLDETFDGRWLRRVLAGRRSAIKVALMNSHLVVGVGNIYASEALFRAGIRPGRAAGRLTVVECERLVAAVKQVLTDAIRQGGTTLRDYVDAEGRPGYFSQALQVYGRDGQPCHHCATPIRRRIQAQRSTYYCPACQH